MKIVEPTWILKYLSEQVIYNKTYNLKYSFKKIYKLDSHCTCGFPTYCINLIYYLLNQFFFF